MLFWIIFYSIFWYICSGDNSYFLLISGLASSVTCYIISHYFGLYDNLKSVKINPIYLFVYIIWLLKEISKASIYILLLIYHPKLHLKSRIIAIKNPNKGNIRSVIYANSTTLTPGTVTIDQDSEILVIHAIDKHSIEIMEDPVLVTKIHKLVKNVNNI